MFCLRIPAGENEKKKFFFWEKDERNNKRVCLWTIFAGEPLPLHWLQVASFKPNIQSFWELLQGASMTVAAFALSSLSSSPLRVRSFKEDLRGQRVAVSLLELLIFSKALQLSS